jgi:hypothetical protein
MTKSRRDSIVKFSTHELAVVGRTVLSNSLNP